jgi:TolB-like protein
MQCLEKDPADRPKNATEALRILDSPEAISGPVAATPEARSRRLRQQVISTGVAALGVLALIAIVVWSLWPRQLDQAATPAVATAAEVGPAVRMVPVTAIGPESQAIAAAMSASIEAALVRDGIRVLSGPALSANGDSAAVQIETTLQRSGQRARALVRVHSRDPAVAVWADRFDFQIDASFAAQDTVSARVLRAVRAAMVRN